MTCYQHPETAAVAFCRSCGRPLCALCQRTHEGTIFCQEHVPMSQTSTKADEAANPYLQPPPVAHPPTSVRTSPGLAFLLGLIPGVGAIYNGQYLKGLLHVAVFGLLVSVIDRSNMAPLMGMFLAGFYFYMAFEAYHTAKKRQMGLAVDEWSSIIPQSALSGRFPVGPILLIVLGVLFLLDELNWIHFYDVVRFWPVLLISLGAYLLYARVSGVVSARSHSPYTPAPPSAYPPAAYPPPAYPSATYPPPPAYPPAAYTPGAGQPDVTQVEVQREQ